MFFKGKSKVVEIELSKICFNSDQPRKIFSENELNELSDSIREFGVIQPIVVKKNPVGGEAYFLIAGERRTRAAKLAGLSHIPAIIRDADEKDTAFIALIENVQRENLSYLEEAAAYQSLMDEYGLTQAEIAKRVGKQQSTISNKIRLLALPDELRNVLADHRLSERHARALLKVGDNKDRKYLLDRIVQHGLNVKQSELLIEEFLSKKDLAQPKPRSFAHINYKIYINTIRKAFQSIQEAEKGASFAQKDCGDSMEICIRIPKSAS